MRPEILFPLFGDLVSLTGIGPRTRTHFERLTGPKIIDLLWHLPVGLLDRRWRPTIEELQENMLATIEVTVGKHQNPPNKRAPYRVLCFDDTGKITLTFFHAHKDYLQKQLPEGETRIISGTVERYGSTMQMTHPDYMVSPEEADKLP